MTPTKLIGVAVAGVLVLLVLVVTGGAPVASGEEPPEGGCAVAINSPVGPGTTSSDQKTAELNASQMAAARTVAGVGVDMGIHERGIAIALGTAMQESTLNPNAVNGRSVGLFQQQGTLYAQVDRTDPAAASRAFYEQLLTQVPTYPDTAAGTFADIAQEVQESGAGASKYAQWEHWAIALARTLLHGAPANPGEDDEVAVNCENGGGSGPITVRRSGQDVTLPREAGIDGAGRDVVLRFPNEKAAIAGAAALSYLGTPYSWGGGGPNGPTTGIRDGGVGDRNGDYKKVGFDCSGLTEYAWAQAGIAIGGDSRTQYTIGGTRLRLGAAQPGDLLFVGDTPATIHHVAMYLGRIFGRDYVIEAPRSGDVVKVSMVVLPVRFRSEVIRPFL